MICKPVYVTGYQSYLNSDVYHADTQSPEYDLKYVNLKKGYTCGISATSRIV